MMDRIKEFFEEILSELRELSYRNSEENIEFTKSKLLAHRQYMEGFRRYGPYTHPDTWQDEPTPQ